MRKRVGSQSGFTLIELMLVIALIGLVAALVLPRGIRQGISSAAMDTEASKIAGAVRLARQKAISSGSPYRILFTEGGYSLYSSASGPPARPTETLDEHVRLDPVLDGGRFIEFDSSGTTGQAGLINITDKVSGRTGKRLRVYAQGTVDIQAP